MNDTNDLPRYLSAKFTEDFAYPTLKDRLPVILTQIVDSLSRLKSKVLQQKGEDALNDLKGVINNLSQLKYEMQTNKPLRPISDDGLDTEDWNACLSKLNEQFSKHPVKFSAGPGLEKTGDNADLPCWFTVHWLFFECYFYRRIAETFRKTSRLKAMDPFNEAKKQSYYSSLEAIHALGGSLYKQLTANSQDIKSQFLAFLKLSLWGNKCDLSISSGAENAQKDDPLMNVEHLDSKVLCNQSEEIWDVLNREGLGTGSVHFVLDNAGYELFSDLCLAEFLIHHKIVERVNFHAKKIPWFVSDVIEEDFVWTLGQLATSEIEPLEHLGRLWQHRIGMSEWMLQDDQFWTLPYEYSQMKTISPELYKDLSDAQLIIFKGDLNHRKLVGDRKWDPTTSFEKSLQGFKPAPLCVIKTLKSDTISGLSPGVAEATNKENPQWMVCGEYGLIQMHSQK